jgi:hypothetical protein
MSLRLIAERWLQRGPGASEHWEFYPAKPPSSGRLSTSIGGKELAHAEVRLSCERVSYRLELDVAVYHPRWASLSENDRALAGFVFLDSTLGEDGVTRWLGAIDMVTSPPPDGITLDDLKVRVAEMAETEATGVILRSKTDAGNPMLTTLDAGVKRIDHLGMDAHVEVRVRFDASRDDGLCDEVEADELNRLEDELLDALGYDAVFVCRRTFEGLRTIHLRAANQGPVVPRAQAWARGQVLPIDVTCSLDPDWATMPW